MCLTHKPSPKEREVLRIFLLKMLRHNLGEIRTKFCRFSKEYIANSLNEKLQPFKVETSAQTFEQRQLQERFRNY